MINSAPFKQDKKLVIFAKNKNKLLPPSPVIGASLIQLLKVDSTNNYATALLHEGMAHHGTVILTEEQYGGKGQRHKAWETEKGKNITMSVIIEPKSLVLSEFFYLSMAMAVGVQRFFQKYAGHDCRIKWPNDLYWRDRKAGGILIENILSGSHWRYAIVGIGININQMRFENLDQAVSLQQITGREYSIPDMVKELCSFLQQAYEELLSDRNQLVRDYHAVLYKLNQPVRLKKDARVFQAIIKGVSVNGELITEHGIEERFSVGEVEWVISASGK